jgi:hypothetical protein
MLLAAIALGAAACGSGDGSSALTRHRAQHVASRPAPTSASTTTTTTLPVPTTTTTTTPPSTTLVPGSGQHGPITEPPLPAPGPGFVADQVTAVGDSVMIDYEGALQADIPGVHVTAAVSRQWTQGEALLAQLKSEGALGAVVIVGLGTNGPITSGEFSSMMGILSGASRVVFVNVHVDRTWQDPNNAVIAQGVAGSPRTVLANWNALATQNPGWLDATQTHLPIDGPGAQALAALVADAA